MLVSGALQGPGPGRRPCSDAFRRALQASRLRVHLSALWQGKRRRGEGRTGRPSQLSLRISEAISAIEARLSGLVHDCAKNHPVERSRHERFIASRMTVGAIALCLLPLYLLIRGVPSGPEYVAMICLVAPVAAAIVLSRSGRLALAHAISSASLAGLVVCIAATSGGVSAGAAVAMPVFAITAIAHAATLAVEHCRVEMHRRTAARLRDASERSLLQAIDDLVTWHDRNGHVVKASPASTKLLGVSPSCLVGRGLLNRVHVSDRPAFLKAISDAALADRPVALEFRLHLEASEGREDRHPARVIWVETRAHRIDAEAGATGAYAVVAVTRDVTEHKRRAEEFERARSDAEEADESKARFLATVSHELRTPLNAIIGFSEMLAATGALEAPAERRREYAEIVHASGLHLLAVVNTLLDMSKIDSGNFDVVPEPFQIAAVVHGCCDLMQLKAEQAGILLTRDIARDLPELVADRRACRQILINLLSNAVKFTPKGGRVSVSVQRRHDRIELAVADTGIGIAEADLPRLGDPFFQAGSAYSRSHEGTGLGLSVVRGLVGLHQGELTIESADGDGTAVTVSLPIDCRGGTRRDSRASVHAVARRPAKANLLKMGVR